MRVSFGLCILAFAAFPAQIGHQDLGAFIAQQPAVAERGRQHILTPSFGPVHAAMFSFPRPIGTTMPDPRQFQAASLDASDVTGALGRDSLRSSRRAPGALEFPSVNRMLKGDRLAVPEAVTSAPEAEDLIEHDAQLEAEIKTSARLPSLSEPAPAAPRLPTPAFLEENPAIQTAELFFGRDLAPFRGALEPWAPGEEPVLMVPRAPVDGDMKLAALTPPDGAPTHGESIAGKGEVTGEGRRPMTPAERLGLSGAARAKAEKCLANAVYFEARGEAVRGQIAVAQVVLNRAFSGYYPSDICGVVYQNSHRHLSCQFTFACDGIRDVVTEHEAWQRATQIAKDTLDGKLWVPEIDKATHYHAYWVRPWWVRTMKTMHKLGVHTFYRPRRWGDGADAPTWGDATATAEAVKNL